MESAARHHPPCVIEIVFKEPFSFDFDQAVMILEAAHPMHPLSPHQHMPYASSMPSFSLADAPHIDFEALQIKANVSLATQASPVHHIDVLKTQRKPIMWVNFLSLAGAQGPLEITYTEMVIERMRTKDTNFRDLLDIFNHRLASLWNKFHRMTKPSTTTKPAIQSALGQCFLGLSGCFTSSQTQKEKNLLHHFLLAYPFYFWQNQRTALGLQKLVQHHFGYPVRVDAFQGQWQSIHPHEQTRIGQHKGAWNALGRTSVLGQKIWQQNAGICITIGPLAYDTFYGFAPFNESNERFLALYTFCRLIVPSTIAIKIEFMMDQTHKKSFYLGTHTKPEGYLGKNTWI